MNNVKVYDFEKALDLYVIKESIQRKVLEGFENEIGTMKSNLEEEINDLLHTFNTTNNGLLDDDDCPKWVKTKLKVGAFGEEIAKLYLENIFKKEVKQVSKISSSIGYDIEVKENGMAIAFEVKTSSIYISYNELKKANLMKNFYNIFYIKFDNERQKVYGYIINNPITILNINYETLIQVIELDETYIIPNKFIINLKPRFIESLRTIDLTKYAQRINDK